MWYIHTMEYYSAIKRNEIPAFLAAWMDLEMIMLSEVCQTRRHHHQMLSLTWNLKEGCSGLLCRTDTDSLTLENMVSKGDSLGGRRYTGGVGWKCYKTGL